MRFSVSYVCCTISVKGKTEEGVRRGLFASPLLAVQKPVVIRVTVVSVELSVRRSWRFGQNLLWSVCVRWKGYQSGGSVVESVWPNSKWI